MINLQHAPILLLCYNRDIDMLDMECFVLGILRVSLCPGKFFKNLFSKTFISGGIFSWNLYSMKTSR